MPVPMGTNATPSKPTGFLPLVARELYVALTVAIAIAPCARDAANRTDLAGKPRPLAQGRDEQQRGDNGVVEQDGRNGPRLILIVVRLDERPVDVQLEACGQRVRCEFGQEGSDARCS